ncbi:MAG: hypothetical protein RMI93_07800 [Caldimicrobium sp.]|nr:hypothetical protein [Caldimicrobium sp.]MDW8183488.1 hypothetical protein [Caldimicrobium sp.]
MEIVERSFPLPEVYDQLRKILAYKRDNLLDFSLAQVAEKLKYSLHLEPKLFLNDLYLELLKKLSYAIYVKSACILDTPFDREEEQEDEAKTRERLFTYFENIPLGRILNEQVFVPQLEGAIGSQFQPGSGDLSLLISTFIDLLDRQVADRSITLELTQPSIEEYISKLQDFLEKKRVIKWEEILTHFELKDLQDVVFFFLAVLFMVFEGLCGVYQGEEETFEIFIKD